MNTRCTLGRFDRSQCILSVEHLVFPLFSPPHRALCPLSLEKGPKIPRCSAIHEGTFGMTRKDCMIGNHFCNLSKTSFGYLRVGNGPRRREQSRQRCHVADSSIRQKNEERGGKQAQRITRKLHIRPRSLTSQACLAVLILGYLMKRKTF